MRRIFLWLAAIVLAFFALVHLTGNAHLFRGLRYTYLIGRDAPEIDDRSFFPYATIPADAPRPWPKSVRYGGVDLDAAQEDRLKALYSAAFVVVHHDSLLFERYFDGWAEDSTMNAFSIAKSYVSILVGMAMDEGVIQSVFQPVGDFLPEFKEGCRAKINLWHLLTMSTGLDWNEKPNPFGENAKGYYGRNVRELSMSLPCTEAPGKRFEYISGSTQIMGEVLEAAYGRDLDRLVREKIWAPLQAEHTAYWGKDRPDGDLKHFCCLYATARDFARLGQLYLDSGRWNGRQIVPLEYWQASITPAAIMDKDGPNRRYGYYWWLAELDGEPIWYARGFHGQYVVVVPHERLVLVRMGMKREEVHATGHPTDVFEWVAIARVLASSKAS
ncbi:MAG: serine hydrolase [Flavobacteriales bacterium]|nr:serine hydrolase [Flavobacteriales bacterium]